MHLASSEHPGACFVYGLVLFWLASHGQHRNRIQLVQFIWYDIFPHRSEISPVSAQYASPPRDFTAEGSDRGLISVERA